MKIDQLNPCPFCGQKPVRHDSVEPAGFVGSSEENQVFLVACMTDGCPPSGLHMPDLEWNMHALTEEALMANIFATLDAEKSPYLEERREAYKVYQKRHE